MRLLKQLTARHNKLYIALMGYYGLSRTTSLQILKALGYSSFTKSHNITLFQKNILENYIIKHHTVELTLRKKKKASINRIKAINSYKAKRYHAGLPVNGQRTRSNAKTAKKKYFNKI